MLDSSFFQLQFHNQESEQYPFNNVEFSSNRSFGSGNSSITQNSRMGKGIDSTQESHDDDSFLGSLLQSHREKKTISYEDYAEAMRALNDRWECEMTKTIQESQELLYEETRNKARAIDKLKQEAAKKQHDVKKETTPRKGPEQQSFQNDFDTLRRELKEEILKRKHREEIVASQMDILSVFEKKISEKHKLNVKALKGGDNFHADVAERMKGHFEHEFEELRSALKREIDTKDIRRMDISRRSMEKLEEEAELEMFRNLNSIQKEEIESEVLHLFKEIFDSFLGSDDQKHITCKNQKYFSKAMLSKINEMVKSFRNKHENNTQIKLRKAKSSLKAQYESKMKDLGINSDEIDEFSNLLEDETELVLRLGKEDENGNGSDCNFDSRKKGEGRRNRKISTGKSRNRGSLVSRICCRGTLDLKD